VNEEQGKILRCAQNDRETMHRQSRDKFRGGFTFVEILVVVVIISIIVTGIIVVASSVLKKARVNATKGIIQNLASALQEYKNYHEANFNGFVTNNNTWIEALYDVPKCKDILKNIPDDHKANEKMINGEYNNTVDTIYDSWDEPIEIESNGAGNFPTIRSLGPDKKRDTADDIINDTITM
jgi:prepilin-type N-terminal cleavage/methylation domain-containing protein